MTPRDGGGGGPTHRTTAANQTSHPRKVSVSTESSGLAPSCRGGYADTWLDGFDYGFRFGLRLAARRLEQLADGDELASDG
jgi:hypothetical protein